MNEQEAQHNAETESLRTMVKELAGHACHLGEMLRMVLFLCAEDNSLTDKARTVLDDWDAWYESGKHQFDGSVDAD